MRLRVAGVLLVVMTATSTACTSGEESTPEPEEPPSPPAPEEAAEDSALEAYEGMWDVVVEASHEGDPDPADLENYASGEALALMRQTLEGVAEDGAQAQGEPALSPEVLETAPEGEPTSAEVLDCMDGTEWVEDEETEESGHRQVDATVETDGLSWRVSELRIWEQGSC